MKRAPVCRFSLVACLVPGLALSLSAQEPGWQYLATAPSPPPRDNACLVFDSVHNATVMHGGRPWHVGAAAYNDTWTWNGAAWTHVFPATVPTWGEGAQMAFDSQRGRCVRFGGWTIGSGSAGVIDQTWEFDGVDWSLRTPAVAPPARRNQAMAYDSIRGRTVMFGGDVLLQTGSAPTLADTWEWDGTQWHDVTPAVSPPARTAARMVFDSARGRCVLFGGTLWNGTTTTWYGDTWEWDGVAWQQMATTGALARASFGMAFDSQRHRTVMFGGWNGVGMVGDTWEWNGVAWSAPAANPPAPTPRVAPAMAFDAPRSRIVMFAGDDGGPVGLGDVWEYGLLPLSASYLPFGVGCAGPLGAPVLGAGSNRPLLGQRFEFTLSNLPPAHSTLIGFGWSNTQWLGAPLPIDLSGIGFVGCRLLISPDIVYAAFNWGGSVTWALDIPNQPVLIGVRFFNQGAAIDASGTSVLFSNGGAARMDDH